jgi:hypothetical protein
MDSRTDSSLVDPPTVRPDGRLEATFTRYAPSDPLCCPSRPKSRAIYRLDRAAAGPTVVLERVEIVTAVAQLPRTGTPSATMLTLAGALVMVAGAVLSRTWPHTRPPPRPSG